MAIGSASTLAEVLVQYNGNLDWDGDLTKAAAALEAVRWLLVNRPASMIREGHRLDYAALDAQRQELERFVRAGRATGRVSFTQGRALP